MKLVKDWSEVTIGQYQEIMTVESENPQTRFINICSIVLDIDPEDIRKMSLSDYIKLQSDMAFLSKEPSRDYKYTFELDGIEYGIIPDMRLVSAGEFIDAETWKENSIDNMHLLAALIWRKIISKDGDDYKIEEHKPEGFMKRAELFRDRLSIEDILGAIFFFIQSEMRLSIAFLDYSSQEMTKEN